MAKTAKILRLVENQPDVRKGGETFKPSNQPRPNPPAASTPSKTQNGSKS